MKKNQLFGILALMLALGISFPVNLFADSNEEDKQPTRKSGATVADSDEESTDELVAAEGEELAEDVTPEEEVAEDETETEEETDAGEGDGEGEEPEEPEEPEETVINPLAIMTEAELVTVLADETVTEIALATDLVVTANLEIRHDVVLNLNGFKIVATAPDLRVMDILSGNVVITGEGKIIAYGEGSAAVRIKGATSADNSNYASVTIGEQVVLMAPEYFGLFVTPNFNAAYGVTVNLYGTIEARDGICINGNIQGTGDNVPVINLMDGARIVADEQSGVALMATGYGIWQLGSIETPEDESDAVREPAKIRAATGIIAQTGVINLNNIDIETTGSPVAAEAWSEGVATGAVVQVENVASVRDLEITLNGGNYISEQSYVFAEYGDPAASESLKSVTILGGVFAGEVGMFYGVADQSMAGATTQIYGGTFSEDISAYLAPVEGLRLEQSVDGLYVVVDDTEPDDEEQIAAKLAEALENLRMLVDWAAHYLDDNYTAGGLGSLQQEVNTALDEVAEMVLKAEDLLARESVDLAEAEQVVADLDGALAYIQSIEDGLREEVTVAIGDAYADRDKYTAESYADLLEVVQRAEVLLTSEQVSLDALYAILGEIDGVRESLIEKEDEEQPDDAELQLANAKATLRALLNEVSILNPADYTPESYNPLVEAATVAGGFLGDGFEPTLEMLQGAIANVEHARAGLVRQSSSSAEIAEAKSNLYAMLEAVQELKASDYREDAGEQFGMLQVAIQKANVLLVNPDATVEDIIAVMDEIKAATSGLKGADDEDLESTFATLESLVIESKSLIETDYTAESYALLAGALATAEEVLSQPDASLADLESALANLRAARNNLVERPTTPIDPTPDNPIDPTPDTPGVPDNPTPDTPTPDDPSVPDDPGVITPTPDDPNMTPSVDWSALEAVIAEIAVLRPSDYTPESYNQLLVLLSQTRALIGADGTTQATADYAVSVLRMAMTSLERADHGVVTPAPIVSTDSSKAPNTGHIVANNHASAGAAEVVQPTFLMSVLAGAYAGLATYRKSRLAAKRRK